MHLYEKQYFKNLLKYKNVKFNIYQSQKKSQRSETVDYFFSKISAAAGRLQVSVPPHNSEDTQWGSDPS